MLASRRIRGRTLYEFFENDQAPDAKLFSYINILSF